MALITISRGSYSKGKIIAEEVAKELGYECVSREVLLEASEHFNVPEIKLIRALHDAPSILDHFTYGKERYIAYIREAFLEHVQKDNVVYHGLAGHFFLQGVGHALKVRIIADLDDRIRLEMERESISAEEARHVLLKDDRERRRWGKYLYGIDTAKAWLYDLVVHIRKLKIEDAVEMICRAAKLPQFETTPASQKALDDLVLAAQVKNSIIQKWPDAQISADDGKIVVHVEAPIIKEPIICDQIIPLVSDLPGVSEARVHVIPSTLLAGH